MNAICAEHELESVLRWSDAKLQDADSTEISRHTRIEAAYDSIYARLLVQARRAGHPVPSGHPCERVILQGAVAAGLSDCWLEEALELSLSVAGHRHSPSVHSVSLPQALALGRHLERLLKG